ncbi:hypothetical protein M378DRAFT_19427 [Amanita muscaria Koide BX008]|uniref:Uncharacterized protein n=1 Tax=Amanita muscaria (strain Koide BX008) TaxID=946122 RepID=A0A0C2SIY6_AMAMK|nr:hypothetical protein M378DRAFT_19427 [Amanita muscaria Koide BX008]
MTTLQQITEMMFRQRNFKQSQGRGIIFPAHPSRPAHLSTLTASYPAGSTGASTPADERKRQPLMLIESMQTFFDLLPKKSPNASNFWSQLAMHKAELVQPGAFESLLSPGSTSPSSPLPYDLTSPSTTINTPAVPIPTRTVSEGTKENV